MSSLVHLENLKYQIVPGRHLQSKSIPPVYESAYLYWKQFWQDIYTQAGSPESFLADDFFRQDYLGILTSNEETVGMLFSTVFDLNQSSTVDHRYFKFYPSSFLDALKAKGIQRVLSVEFLTANPKWRKSVTGLSYAEAIISLSMNMFRETPAEAVIGTARTDNKVHDACYKLGFQCITPAVNRRNFTVDLIAATKSDLRQHPDPTISRLVQDLWRSKIDYTGHFIPSEEKKIQQEAA